MSAMIEEDNYTSEIFIKVKALATQFAYFLQTEIIKVFSNYFTPINLYKLRLIKGWNNLYQDQIHIDKAFLKMHKVTDFYIDYGTISTLSSKIFLNYTMILMILFGLTIPTLYPAFRAFITKS